MPDSFEDQIMHWRTYVRRGETRDPAHLASLEIQLRQHLDELTRSGLSTDEALLVAARRVGKTEPLSWQFAREQVGGAVREETAPASSTRSWDGKDAVVAFSLAVAAAVAIKLPTLFGLQIETNEAFYIRNAGLFVLPFLTWFFIWKRGASAVPVGLLAIGFVAAAVAANLYHFTSIKPREELTALHLPAALWFLVGIAHAGGRWKETAGRMDFIRFSGEVFIQYVLIALGGGVFCAFTAVTFQSIGVDIEKFFGSWLIPCGAAGAVIVAAWLVESRQRMIEAMAPVLARIFTPLFTLMLLAFLGALVVSGRGISIEREMLIAFDLLLAVVLGLVLYSISARDPRTPPGFFDGLQVVLVISALVANAVALWAIGARINEFGYSPNRAAALGENLILLVNLTWTAVLYLRIFTKRSSFAALEKWQTSYLPVFAIWAAIVVIVFPILFR